MHGVKLGRKFCGDDQRGCLRGCADEWKGVMQPLLLSYVQPEQLYTLSLEFVLLFWRLSLSDILVPNEQYEASLAKLSASLDEVRP